MAVQHARANVCTSGAVYCGLYTRAISIYMGGTDRTRQIFQDWSASYALDSEPGAGRFATRQFTPTEYNEVVVYNGGTAGVPLWRGRVLDVESSAQNWRHAATHRITAQDNRWLLDRFAKVTRQYRSLGANSIVADILASFTNGGFKVGYIASSLGNVDAIDFSQETVTQAISRVAKAVSAVWVLDPENYVSLVSTTVPDGNPLTLTDGVRGYWDLKIRKSMFQSRTRVYFEGGGSPAAAAVSPSATTIPVQETFWYSSTGGTVRVGQNLVTYTGRSTDSGAGSLTGCSGITYSIAIGDEVTVLTQTDDATAQTAVATALAGGLSGIIVDVQADGRLSLVECQGRGALDIALFSNGVTSLDYTTDKEFTSVGKQVSATLTKPRAVTATFQIQAVTMRLKRDAQGHLSPSKLQYEVQSGPYRRTLTDVLRDPSIRLTQR